MTENDSDSPVASPKTKTEPEAPKAPDEPPDRLKEWGAALGMMLVLALAFYALISMFKRGF